MGSGGGRDGQGGPHWPLPVALLPLSGSLKKKTFMGHSSDKSSLSLGLFPPLSFDNLVMNSAVVGDVLLKWSEVCTLCLLLRTVLCDLSVRFRTLAGKWIEVSFLALI